MITFELFVKAFRLASFGCGCCADHDGAGGVNRSRINYFANCIEKGVDPTEEGWQEWGGERVPSLFDFDAPYKTLAEIAGEDE